jgi:hypothetical protein
MRSPNACKKSAGRPYDQLDTSAGRGELGKPVQMPEKAGRRIMTPEEKIAIGKRFHDALTARDWPSIRALLTDDAKWMLPGDNLISGTAIGADDVTARAQKIAGFGLTFALQRILVSPDNFALQLRIAWPVQQHIAEQEVGKLNQEGAIRWHRRAFVVRVFCLEILTGGMGSGVRLRVLDVSHPARLRVVNPTHSTLYDGTDALPKRFWRMRAQGRPRLLALRGHLSRTRSFTLQKRF